MVDSLNITASARQASYDIRFEWGPGGVEMLAGATDVVVVIDTLSFSTAVEIAVSQGAAVYPYRFRDSSAAGFAAQSGARLAVSRSEVSASQPFSLSPKAMLGAQPGEKIVLPSPNGAHLTLKAAEHCACVLCGCLRNAAAVASAARQLGRAVLVAAAGEQWRGGSGDLRSALEDMLGAGCIISHLQGRLSPEARIAAESYRAASSEIESLLMECVSGRELAGIGFEEDVRLAAQVDVSRTVPRLIEGAYVRYSPQ